MTTGERTETTRQGRRLLERLDGLKAQLADTLDDAKANQATGPLRRRLDRALGSAEAAIGQLRGLLDERERLDRERRAERRRHQAVFEMATGALLMTDEEGAIERVNPAAAELFGLPADQLEERSVPEMLPEESLSAFRPLLDGLPADGETVDRRLTFQRHGGEEMKTLTRLRRCTGPDGSTDGLVWEIQDTTEIDSLRECVRNTHRRQLLSRMAGGVAHEFKNILNIIYSWCDVGMRRCDDDDRVRTPFEYIKRAARRGGDLTESLVSYSGDDGAEPELLEVQEILEATIRILEAVLPSRIDLELNVPEETVRVRFDRGELEQIMLNLVLNARDAISGAGRIEVRCDYHRLDGRETFAGGTRLTAGDYVCIQVEDTGCGMDDETLHEVSKPYVSHNRERGGNGLGLPMVIEMVQQRDGAVDIDSQPDEGTCVSVLLPRPESNHDSDDDSDSGDEEGDDPTDGSDHILARLLHGPSNRPKILLVDDNPPVRTFMRYYIEQHGFEVLDAENARDARGILEETSSIDLMIVDTVLPTRRGPDLARDLHERGLTAPVLYYSKHSFSDLVESGHLSADDPFLDDPLKAGELIDTIEKLFDGGPDGPTCRRRATG